MGLIGAKFENQSNCGGEGCGGSVEKGGKESSTAGGGAVRGLGRGGLGRKGKCYKTFWALVGLKKKKEKIPQDIT